jgi:hypothetical protein
MSEVTRVGVGGRTMTGIRTGLSGAGGLIRLILRRDRVILPAWLIATAGIVLQWPGRVQIDEDPFVPDQQTRLVDAVLLEVEELGEDEFGLIPGATEVFVTAQIEETGEVVGIDMIDETGDTFEPGQRVKLQEIQGPEGDVSYLVSDFQRHWPLLVLVGLFLTAVIGFGRWQGLRALVGLVFTFVLIIGFIIPAILSGESPVAVALTGAVAIMIATLYLAHGYSSKTTAAVVGTALALLLTGALAAAVVGAANLTGFTSEEARLANLEVGGLSRRGPPGGLTTGARAPRRPG